MSIYDALIPFFVYLVPSFILFYMAIDVFLRNQKSTKHRLAALIIFGYVMLFLTEYVRYRLPIDYSPAVVTFWFGNIGTFIPCFGFHFLSKVTHLEDRVPKKLYPWIFYLPAIVVPLTIVTGENMINSQQFIQKGLWKTPIYNTTYFTTVAVGCLFIIIYLLILWRARKHTETAAQRSVIHLLLIAISSVLVWTAVFGFINFEGFLPPHPYIFAGLIWSVFLRRSMKKYDFLSSHAQRYEALFRLNPLMILLLDYKGRVKEANPSAQKLLKLDSSIDHAFDSYISGTDKEEWKRVFEQALRSEKKVMNADYQLNVGSHTIDAEVNADYVLVDQIPHLILIIRDVTSDKRNKEKIRFLAYHDPLTKIPNRRYFKQEIEHVLQRVHETGEEDSFAIVLLDLDHFKYVNDQYGHQTGDEFLQHTARILEELISGAGIAARLAGDEFVLYIPRITRTDAEVYVRQVMERLQSLPYRRGNIHLPIRVSIGISLYPDHGKNYDSLLNQADKAMYEAKNSGRNSYSINR